MSGRQASPPPPDSIQTLLEYQWRNERGRVHHPSSAFCSMGGRPQTQTPESSSAAPLTPGELLSSFTFSPSGDLWGCVLDIEMEVPITVEGEDQKGVLSVDLALGK